MKKSELINQLKKGEKSAFTKDFNRKLFLKNLHEKYLINPSYANTLST